MKSIIYLLFLSVLLMNGCSLIQVKSDTFEQDLPLYPAPPAEPKIQYLFSLSSSSDITQFSKMDKFLFGDQLLALETSIEKPYGVAMHDGKIYICDSMLPGIIIVDLENNTFKPFTPSGRGLIRKPINVAIDENGWMYVTDTERNQVVVFDSNLKYSHSLSNDSLKPLDLAIKGDSLFVVDYEDRVIELWSISERKYLGDFPPNHSELPDTARLFVPYAIAIAPNGNVYITDYGQFRIQEYSGAGQYIKTYGSLGTSSGSFARPKGLTVDKNGNVFVVDAAFENVQMFNNEAQLLMFFGGPYHGIGDMYLPAQISIDYEYVAYFEDMVIPGFDLDYLILVTNQYGPEKLSIYGFLKPEIP